MSSSIRTKRTAVAAAAVGLSVLFVSQLNPLMNAGMNNRLEAACPEELSSGWVYDRSAWTPVAWTCTVTYPDGREELVRALG